MVGLSVCLVFLLCSSIYAAEHSYFDFIDVPSDEFGNEIGHDRLSEMAAMRSTRLGYGFDGKGHHSQQPPRFPPASFGDFSAPQFGSDAMDFMHHIFKRQAPGFGPEPHFPTKDSFGPDPFVKNQFVDGFKSAEGNLRPFQDHEATFQPKKEVKVRCTQKPVTCRRSAKYRSYDGHCNNMNNPTWGATMQPLMRLLPPHYADGALMPRMFSRIKDRNGRYPMLPSPRFISRNILLPDDGDDKHLPDISNMVMQWGQFLDHDITGTPVSKTPSGEDLKCCRNVGLTESHPHHPDVFEGKPCFPIYIPPGDRAFYSTCMNFARSQPEPRKLMCEEGYREQMNMLTAFIDGSQIYGSSFKDMSALRSYRIGQMKVSDGNLLPEDRNATCIKDNIDDYCFKAGDERVNEQPALAAVHTTFHRYHNMLSMTLHRINPHWDDEKLFMESRKIIGGILQHITYFEWLPIILGPGYMEQYRLGVAGREFQPYSSNNWFYDPSTEPTIINAFASAAFRFGHSLVPSKFSIGNRREKLRNMFNRPKFLLEDNGEGMNKICNGLTSDPIQHFDHFFTTDLTDHLFEDFQNMSLDLPSLNMQRGRDHGLPPYNDYRKVCNLPPLENYDTLKINFPAKADLLSKAYGHVDDIDLFVGGISESPISGGLVGPTFACIIAEQFRRIKFGDRFWYETQDSTSGFTLAQLKEIKKMSLARIMCDSTNFVTVQRHVFLQPSYLNPKILCRDIPDLDYTKWRE